MPNIMINTYCNLRCPYCFADECIETSSQKNITFSNFLTALDFITKTSSFVGIIGGEPTLHPDFENLVTFAVANNKIDKVTVFTNGITLSNHVPVLNHSKIGLLVNVNSPEIIGEMKYNQIKDGINAYMKVNSSRLSLGLNLYHPNMDYTFIVDLLSYFGLKRLRLSIPVPNFRKDIINPLDHFKTMKPVFLKLIDSLHKINVLPHLDCNYIPKCIFTAEEYQYLQNRLEPMEKQRGDKSCIIDSFNCKHCVIDILPSLKAVRCFALSQHEVPISRFNNLEDLSGYFQKKIDHKCWNVCNSDECANCYEHETMKCSAGCLLFKTLQLKI